MTKTQKGIRAKNKGGRPKSKINFKSLDAMLKIQCTGEECASILNIDYDTLNAILLREKGKSFSEYSAIKRAGGKMSLRRRQFKMAESSPAMAIWLGKQYLDQKDKAEVEHSGKVTFTHEQREKKIANLRRELIESQN